MTIVAVVNAGIHFTVSLTTMTIGEAGVHDASTIVARAFIDACGKGAFDNEYMK